MGNLSYVFILTLYEVMRVSDHEVKPACNCWDNVQHTFARHNTQRCTAWHTRARPIHTSLLVTSLSRHCFQRLSSGTPRWWWRWEKKHYVHLASTRVEFKYSRTWKRYSWKIIVDYPVLIANTKSIDFRTARFPDCPVFYKYSPAKQTI